MDLSKPDSLKEMTVIREEIDRLFDSFFGRRPRLTRGEESEWSPVVDVQETPEAFLVIAEIPGVRKEDINILVTDDRLSISGNRKKRQMKDTTSHRSERSFGRFRRVIPLHPEIRPDRATASYEDGLLSVTVPKAEKAKSKEISVDVQ